MDQRGPGRDAKPALELRTKFLVAAVESVSEEGLGALNEEVFWYWQ